MDFVFGQLHFISGVRVRGISFRKPQQGRDVVEVVLRPLCMCVHMMTNQLFYTSQTVTFMKTILDPALLSDTQLAKVFTL